MKNFIFLNMPGRPTFYGFAALYEYAVTDTFSEYAGTAAKAKSREQEYPPIELGQALVSN